MILSLCLFFFNLAAKLPAATFQTSEQIFLKHHCAAKGPQRTKQLGLKGKQNQ